MRYGLYTEEFRANEKSAKRILKNIVYFSIETHFMVIVHIDDIVRIKREGQGSGSRLLAIGFVTNSGLKPLKKHTAFNVGPSSARQHNAI